MSSLQPILSAPNDAPILNIGSARLAHRITSDQTNGAFSVVEFLSGPGEGVGLHVHEHEDELVYLLEGQIEVTLGDRTMAVLSGACALLPRGVPHGYVTTGDRPSRLLAMLLPGRLDGFFMKLDGALASEGPHESAIETLCRDYGIEFLETARS